MRGSSRRIWTARSKPSACMTRSSSRQVTRCGRTRQPGSRRSTRSGRRSARSSRRTSHRKRPVRRRRRRASSSGRCASRIRVASRPGTLAGLLATWDFAPGITQNCWADDAAAKKKIAAEITKLHTAFRTDVVQPFLAAWRQYIYRLSVTLLTTARDHAARERRRGNTLNYGDLLQLAARVLRGNAEVRRALQGKYRWLFVDEFQDTDPVQAEIIFLLAGEDAGSSTSGEAGPHAVGEPRGRLALDTAPSRRAVRRRRSQAVDLPLPSRGHRQTKLRPGDRRRPPSRSVGCAPGRSLSA